MVDQLQDPMIFWLLAMSLPNCSGTTQIIQIEWKVTGLLKEKIFILCRGCSIYTSIYEINPCRWIIFFIYNLPLELLLLAQRKKGESKKFWRTKGTMKLYLQGFFRFMDGEAKRILMKNFVWIQPTQTK